MRAFVNGCGQHNTMTLTMDMLHLLGVDSVLLLQKRLNDLQLL
jgi:hypothetical protein